MAKYKYIGALPGVINGRIYETGEKVDLSDETVVQTADVTDEPLFEAVAATKKASATTEKE